MMKNRRFFSVTFSLLVIFLFLHFLPSPALAQSRGITVKTKTPAGDIKEIPLYSGYHALVIGVSDYDVWPDLPSAAKEALEVAQVFEQVVRSAFRFRRRMAKKAKNIIRWEPSQLLPAERSRR